MSEFYRPGCAVPCDGVYVIIGPYGGRTGVKRRCRKGHPFPPTVKHGQVFVLHREVES